MKKELSYMLVTPYTLSKSRTGGVLSRLLSRIDLEFVGAQVFSPSKKMADAYADSIEKNSTEDDKKITDLLANYVRTNFVSTDDKRRRVMLLLFKGEDAAVKLSRIAGALTYKNSSIESITGETIRDTYADMVMSLENTDKVQYFEPAVFTARSKENAEINLKIFADFLKNEPAIIENMHYSDPLNIERTLVIIKPDNWKYASSKPGTIIDMFSRTGLRLIGCKIQKMSVAQGLEFYGPVKDVLVEKLGPVFGKKGKEALEEKFDIKLSDESYKKITDSFGAEYAIDQFNQIIEFMAGTKPPECPADELEKPGKVKSMVLIYEGVDAVNKIRDVLGPTDPTKAPGGTIRREFGSNIMVNTAHASDSVDNCKREMGIIRILDNNCYALMEDYLS
ncbi:MAG: nucleoside-diphosphate kinase [Spirochaetia bacterium]|jgi:nucleoside diphosphate kinase|nr:nucleoside-diphosphate kinase [Spirochaetia bacterium]